MAPSAKYLSFLFLLFLISSLQIHARESQFFSKVTRDNNSSSSNNNKKAAAKETELPESEGPSSAQDEEPSFTPQNHNSFGLYGHGSEQFSPNSVKDAYYTPSNFPEKPHTQQYSTRENSEQKSFTNYNYNGYQTKQQSLSDNMDTAYLNNNYRYDTKQQDTSNTRYVDTAYLNNNNNYRYDTKQQGTSDTRYVDTAYLNNNNNNNNYRYKTKQQGMSDSRYVDTAYLNNNNYYNGKENKQQGMSDTRFLENGKYFYGNNNGQYETDQKESQNGYGSYRGVESRGGYNGNNKNSYEYTNSMDEFQNQDQEFHENQEEHIP